MARWRRHRGGGVARAAAAAGAAATTAVLALAATAATAAAAAAAADCMAMVNMTSYYTRTIMLVVRTSPAPPARWCSILFVFLSGWGMEGAVPAPRPTGCDPRICRRWERVRDE